MAGEYASAKPAAEPKKKDLTDDEKAAICKQAVERYRKWAEKEQDNTDEAYNDLKFRAGEQWDAKALAARKDRPTLTINRIPQFIRQVTGDMRQMKPGIKVVPVDSRGDKETAETEAGMIRYIENRSDAAGIYMEGAESQVTCGIGHWQVTKEYADGTTFNQELRVIGIDDQVAVAWDGDAKLPMKEDAKWCLLPVDMSRETFKENYPEAPVEDFDDPTIKSASADGWFDQDFVRVAVYWVKKPFKRLLALLPDGGVADLTGKDEAGRMQIGASAVRVEERDSFKVCRYLITACHVLEDTDWPGMNIPVIPCEGEKIKIGKRVVRHGLTRFARDPQRMVNYYSSAEAETVALQPKSPWLATATNIEKHQPMWATANTEAHNVLIWTPDSKNGNQPPQRVQPAVSSQGISEGLDRAVNDMKGVIGIYDAGLGNKSNETSGKAILARQREGDVGTFIYIDNWQRSIKRTGAILIDLIPHVYDTERQIRIMGEDGKVDLKWINKPVGAQIMGDDGEPVGEQKIENDVTIGAYDVVLETGPSYTTKRQEAKEQMTEFIRSAPETAPAIMDLVAKAQDWPMADEIGERLEAVAPGPIQELIKAQKRERNGGQPTPEEQQQDMAAAQKRQVEQAAVQLDLQGKELANAKLAAETKKIAAEAATGPDQVGPAERQRMFIEMRTADQQFEMAQREMAHKERLAAIQLETALVELAKAKQGLVADTTTTALDVAERQEGMVRDAETHAATLTRDMQSHGADMQARGMAMQREDAAERRADEAHGSALEQNAARIKQMSQKPKPNGRQE